MAGTLDSHEVTSENIFSDTYIHSFLNFHLNLLLWTFHFHPFGVCDSTSKTRHSRVHQMFSLQLFFTIYF